jgi:hypothetical protein
MDKSTITDVTELRTDDPLFAPSADALSNLNADDRMLEITGKMPGGSFGMRASQQSLDALAAHPTMRAAYAKWKNR